MHRQPLKPVVLFQHTRRPTETVSILALRQQQALRYTAQSHRIGRAARHTYWTCVPSVETG